MILVCKMINLKNNLSKQLRYEEFFTVKGTVKIEFLLILTIFIHSHVETFFQPARLTLITMCLVNDTTSGTCLTSVKRKKIFIKNLYVNKHLIFVFFCKSCVYRINFSNIIYNIFITAFFIRLTMAEILPLHAPYFLHARVKMILMP